MRQHVLVFTSPSRVTWRRKYSALRRTSSTWLLVHRFISAAGKLQSRETIRNPALVFKRYQVIYSGIRLFIRRFLINRFRFIVSLEFAEGNINNSHQSCLLATNKGSKEFLGSDMRFVSCVLCTVDLRSFRIFAYSFADTLNIPFKIFESSLKAFFFI